MENLTYIYALKDPNTNNVRHIGKSNNPLRRLNLYHIPQTKLKRTYKECWISSLLNMNKKPILEILEEVNLKNWCEKEKHYIKYYNKLGNKLVNGTTGGESFNFTDIIKKKISKSLINNKYSSKSIIQYDLYGNKINEFPSISEAERITKIAASNICSALKGKLNIAGASCWSYKDETKDFNVTSHKIIVYQINNGIIINTFESIKEVSIEINRHPSSIRSALNKLNRKSGGYNWFSKEYYESLK